ncbi:nuclear transport factor 2 family protein [Chitinophaga nivalis]|uniref:Nuclear transport factor 2 family protein n=1 Tax=Chitinophaga nivalis TaxID=2991709 RepID=A0ABT3IQP2_9BACT|nr:nuclear transport factor 2 family protein [Chitinophaga nivalis]MCW3464003.1 nuclear transport factor 2 family protein [Chitinophaga nivalis]MCW3486307.1 nuclear transport factor 2 family protein [Chitinophaga nivalis]
MLQDQSTSARAVVLAFINALNTEDFDAARQTIHDDLHFAGVLGSRDGADTYLAEMKKMRLKYDIKKVFADDEEVSLFYDIQMGDKTIFSSGWYQVENGKIKSFRVIFDPRPLLENAA